LQFKFEGLLARTPKSDNIDFVPVKILPFCTERELHVFLKILKHAICAQKPHIQHFAHTLSFIFGLEDCKPVSIFVAGYPNL